MIVLVIILLILFITLSFAFASYIFIGDTSSLFETICGLSFGLIVYLIFYMFPIGSGIKNALSEYLIWRVKRKEEYQEDMCNLEKRKELLEKREKEIDDIIINKENELKNYYNSEYSKLRITLLDAFHKKEQELSNLEQLLYDTNRDKENELNKLEKYLIIEQEKLSADIIAFEKKQSEFKATLKDIEYYWEEEIIKSNKSIENNGNVPLVSISENSFDDGLAFRSDVLFLVATHKAILDKKYKNIFNLLTEEKNTYKEKNLNLSNRSKELELFEKSLIERSKNIDDEINCRLRERIDTIESIEKRLLVRTKKLDEEIDIKVAERVNELKENYKLTINSMLYDTNLSFPYLSDVISDIMHSYDKDLAKHLRSRRPPAKKAADEVSRIAKEKRELNVAYKRLAYQLSIYESLFPWLEEFKEQTPAQLNEWLSTTSTSDDEYEKLRTWLSPQEFSQLSKTEKLELALARYSKRKKSNWEVGIEYERYIGYKYESHGFKVIYNGAVEGLEDMGRDIVATFGNKTYVIQCKRWAKEKIIHEKHIFQLYGTGLLYHLDHPEQIVEYVLVSSCKLSDVAEKVAKHLGITIVSDYAIEVYPLVKCNISKDGEKIYHLPFDQQYDRINITYSKGEFYAYTIKEAEEKGFRHAYKWSGS